MQARQEARSAFARPLRRDSLLCAGPLREDASKTKRRGLYTFLRNEPTVFHRNLLCNLHCMSDLWLKFIREFGGFVLENEPTGGVF